MKSGNWIPICKALVKKLPVDRPFSEVEAAFSLQMNCDDNQDVSVAGLAARWMWSRRRVRSFIEEMGGVVSYADDTNSRQNQRGQIVIQIPDRYRTDTGQIRLIDSSNLCEKADRKRTESGQKADRSRSTIINLDTNPNPKDKKTGRSSSEKKQAPKNTYGTFENVFLTEEELEKLKVRFNGTMQDRIDALSEGIKSKGYKYDDHYATILAWARRDEKKNGGKKNAGTSDEQRAARLSRIFQDNTKT